MKRTQPMRFLISITAPTASKTALLAMIKTNLASIPAQTVTVKETDDPEARAFIAEAAVKRLQQQLGETAEAKKLAKEARERATLVRLEKKYAPIKAKTPRSKAKASV